MRDGLTVVFGVEEGRTMIGDDPVDEE